MLVACATAAGAGGGEGVEAGVGVSERGAGPGPGVAEPPRERQTQALSGDVHRSNSSLVRRFFWPKEYPEPWFWDSVIPVRSEIVVHRSKKNPSHFEFNQILFEFKFSFLISSEIRSFRSPLFFGQPDPKKMRSTRQRS